jgi:hypothetical protein
VEPGQPILADPPEHRAVIVVNLVTIQDPPASRDRLLEQPAVLTEHTLRAVDVNMRCADRSTFAVSPASAASARSNAVFK